MLVPVATPSVGVVKFMFVADRPLGSVVDIDGTPLPFVTRTLLIGLDRLPTNPPLLTITPLGVPLEIVVVPTVIDDAGTDAEKV